MNVSRPRHTVLLLIAMLAGSLTAAWAEAPGRGPDPIQTVTISAPIATVTVTVPAATVTVTVTEVNDAPSGRLPVARMTLNGAEFKRVEAAAGFLVERGEPQMAGRVRTLLAQGRIAPGDSGKARSEAGRIMLDFPIPAGDGSAPFATADAFRLAVTLSHFIALEDSAIFDRWGVDGASIFDRWGNSNWVVNWLDDLKGDHLKIADSDSPRPQDRHWGRSISEMASFTETFFTTEHPRSDWSPFRSEAEFREWCSGIRLEAVSESLKKSPGRSIERGTVGGAERPEGPSGGDGPVGSGGASQGGDAGAGGDGGAGGPAVGAPMP